MTPSLLNRNPVSIIPFAALAAVILLLAGCSSGSESVSTESGSENRTIETPVVDLCPAQPIEVAVSVDQWGGIVEQLAGSCAEVTSIVSGGAVDPHDFEPTPADAAVLGRADLIVINGGHYDEWAENAIEARSPQPEVLDVSNLMILVEGSDNPHLWYAPDVVRLTADRVTEALRAAVPGADDYFTARAAEFDASMEEYFTLIGELRTKFETGQGGAVTYAATESVFGSMATTLGMVDVTPDGFARAVSNESEPSPGDVAEFMDALADGSVAVLIINSQSTSAMTDRLREQAQSNGVAVVEITETIAPGAASFAEWQVAQLRNLETALGR
jgi:zinc/manganese transport system substrate-binding protein